MQVQNKSTIHIHLYGWLHMSSFTMDAKFVFDKLYKIILVCVINFVKLFPNKCPCSKTGRKLGKGGVRASFALTLKFLHISPILAQWPGPRCSKPD